MPLGKTISSKLKKQLSQLSKRSTDSTDSADFDDEPFLNFIKIAVSLSLSQLLKKRLTIPKQAVFYTRRPVIFKTIQCFLNLKDNILFL